MRDATGCEVVYIGGQPMSFDQDGEAVRACGSDFPGQRQGVDQAGRDDGRAAAVEEAPVDADVVADQISAVGPSGEFGLDSRDGRRGPEGWVGQSG